MYEPLPSPRQSHAQNDPKTLPGPRPAMSATSTWAPAEISCWTTAAWPSRAAKCSAVRPRAPRMRRGRRGQQRLPLRNKAYSHGMFLQVVGKNSEYIYIYISLSLFCLRCTKGSLEWAGKASVNIHHRPPRSFTVLAPLEKAFGAWSLEMLLPSSIGRELWAPKSLEAATFTKQEIGNPSLFCLRCTKGSLEWAGKASVNIHHRPPHSFTVLAPLEKAFGAWSLEMLLPSSVSPLLPAKFKRNHSTLQAYLERNSTLAFAKGAKE